MSTIWRPSPPARRPPDPQRSGEPEFRLPRRSGRTDESLPPPPGLRPFMPNVPDHADDAAAPREVDRAPDGGLAREIVARRRLAADGHRLSAGPIRIREEAPGNEWRSECPEVVRSHGTEVELLVWRQHASGIANSFVTIRREFGHLDAIAVAISKQGYNAFVLNYRAGWRCSDHARSRRGCLVYLPKREVAGRWQGYSLWEVLPVQEWPPQSGRTAWPISEGTACQSRQRS